MNLQLYKSESEEYNLLDDLIIVPDHYIRMNIFRYLKNSPISSSLKFSITDKDLFDEPIYIISNTLYTPYQLDDCIISEVLSKIVSHYLFIETTISEDQLPEFTLDNSITLEISRLYNHDDLSKLITDLNATSYHIYRLPRKDDNYQDNLVYRSNKLITVNRSLYLTKIYKYVLNPHDGRDEHYLGFRFKSLDLVNKNLLGRLLYDNKDRIIDKVLDELLSRVKRAKS